MHHINQKNHLTNHAIAVFGLLFSAACWGVIWYPYRMLADVGISGTASSFYTYGIATIIAAIAFAKHWRGVFKQPLSIVCLGIAAGWTNLSYVLAVIDGEVMRVMLLFYLSPLWTLILAHFFLKEHTSRRSLMVIAVSLLGAFMMLHDFSGRLSAWPLPRNTSEWLALSAGMGFSLTNVITRKSTHLSLRAKSFAVWVGVFGVSFFALFFVHAPMSQAGFVSLTPTTLSLAQWLVILSIAVLLVAATLFVQYGMTKIAATRASVLCLFELVVAAIASYYLAHEVMTVNEWLGGILIVFAAVFSAIDAND